MLDAPQLDKQALAKLNLDNQPFLPPSQCEDYFVNTALGMLINGVFQQLANHDGIQVIKGEFGIGKTSFCHRLLCEVPDGLSIELHKAKPGHTINMLLQTMAGLDESATAAGTQELAVQAANRIFRQLYNQQQPVLLIDDAHLLTPKALQPLFKFLNAVAKQNYGRLKLILVGERKIDETLAKIDASLLNPDDIFSTLLRPLNRQDIEHYIQYRLEHAGANQAMPLTKKELAAVQSQCGGLPNKINQLTCGALNKRNGNFGGKPFGKIFPGSIVLAAILAPLVFWLTANRPADSPAALTNSTSHEITNNNQSNMKTADKSSSGATTSPGIATTAQIRLKEETEPVTLNKSDNSTTDASGNSLEPAGGYSELPTIPEPIMIASNRESETQKETFPSQAIGEVIDHSLSETWLASQPESYYMIQLAGTWNLESLRNYSRQFNLSKTLVFHRGSRNGQEWYVLLYGPFQDHSAAHHGISELPLEVQANNPWIRPVAALRKTP